MLNFPASAPDRVQRRHHASVDGNSVELQFPEYSKRPLEKTTGSAQLPLLMKSHSISYIYSVSVVRWPMASR